MCACVRACVRACVCVCVMQQELLARARPGPWQYHSTLLTDQTLDALVCETLREQVRWIGWAETSRWAGVRVCHGGCGWRQYFYALRQELPFTLQQASHRHARVGRPGLLCILRETHAVVALCMLSVWSAWRTWPAS